MKTDSNISATSRFKDNTIEKGIEDDIIVKE